MKKNFTGLTKPKYKNHCRLASVVALALLISGVVSGCTTVGYYSQIVSGHMRIVMGKRSVADIVADDSVNEVIKHRLQVAKEAREFAIEKLGLPDNQSYTSFYDTGRRYVTWNVVAADEFSFRPQKWCFPVAGCVSYRGYYAEEDAQSYADNLADQGLDVAVNGATAYSTLGWFKDPLLNTMLARSDPAIASLLFHELAHQQLYVGDDSTFNESFASFVEKEGLKQWQAYQQESNARAIPGDITEEMSARKARREDFIALLRRTRDDLQVIYKSSLDENKMRAEKAARFQQMRDEYQGLKKSWGDYQGYDGWFNRELNNARLVSVGTYNDYVPAFEEMFKESGSSFQTFYVTALRVSKLPAQERTEVMAALLEKNASVASQ